MVILVIKLIIVDVQLMLSFHSAPDFFPILYLIKSACAPVFSSWIILYAWHHINLDIQFCLGDNWNKETWWLIHGNTNNGQNICEMRIQISKLSTYYRGVHEISGAETKAACKYLKAQKAAFPRFNNYVLVSGNLEASWLGCAPTYCLGSLFVFNRDSNTGNNKPCWILKCKHILFFALLIGKCIRRRFWW